jgi:hypothetical protein
VNAATIRYDAAARDSSDSAAVVVDGVGGVVDVVGGVVAVDVSGSVGDVDVGVVEVVVVGVPGADMALADFVAVRAGSSRQGDGSDGRKPFGDT